MVEKNTRRITMLFFHTKKNTNIPIHPFSLIVGDVLWSCGVFSHVKQKIHVHVSGVGLLFAVCLFVFFDNRGLRIRSTQMKSENFSKLWV